MITYIAFAFRVVFLRVAIFFVLRAQNGRTQGLSLGASEIIRFGCSQLVVERIDPLVALELNID